MPFCTRSLEKLFDMVNKCGFEEALGDISEAREH